MRFQASSATTFLLFVQYLLDVLLVKHLPDGREGLFNVVACFGWRLRKIIKLFYLLKLFRFINAYLTLIFAILLVCNQKAECVRLRLVLDFGVPTVHMLEGFQTGYIVSQEYSMGPSIKYLCNRLKILLACSIPNLKFDLALVYFKQQGTKFDANCDLMILHKLVGSNAMHQAWLTHAAVTNNDKLEQMIKLLRRRLALILHDLTWYFRDILFLHLLNLLLNVFCGHIRFGTTSSCLGFHYFSENLYYNKIFE